MERLVSAADANRRFSEILRDVRQGQTFVVTSHGAPVARIAPFEPATASRADAKRRLLAHLAEQVPTSIGRWTRDELYER